MIFSYHSPSLPRSVFARLNQQIRYLLPHHRLFPQVNWEEVDSGKYAIVDPVNPGSILYLTEQDYIIMIRVALTTNRTVKVLAAPGEDLRDLDPNFKRDDSSKTSPTYGHPFLEELQYKGSPVSRARGEKRVLNLFHSPFKNMKARAVDGEKVSMITLTHRNVCSWFTKWHDMVSWWTRGSQLTTVAMAERTTFGLQLLSYLKHNGINYVISRMKISLFVLNSFLGGKKLASTQDLGMRIKLTSGLPADLPLFVRNGIRTGNKHFIHIWTSMFNSYKGLAGSYKGPTLDTIRAVHPDFAGNEVFNDFREEFAPKLWEALQGLGVRLFPDLTIRRMFFTSHAGPAHANAVLGSARDAFVWSYKAPFNLVKEWLKATQSNSEAFTLFRHQAKRYRLVAEMLSLESKPKGWKPLGWIFGADREEGLRKAEGALGRLHCLYEAAGKVRIVAIVDYWTQCCLKPLHDWMFGILRKLPQDATFDQEGALRRFAEKVGKSDTVYSIDLKSATDLIPIGLYRSLFCWALPENVLSLWIRLLVDRVFLLPKEFNTPHSRREIIVEKGKEATDEDERFVRYTCGQPMGALSSWSSMALTHHALVLFSAWRAGWAGNTVLDFTDYLVLGDDLVIADEAVAQEYISVAASLGIKVGLAKSYISEIGMFNFANQTYVSGQNVSPISLREEVGVDSLNARAELAMRMVRRGWADVTSTKWIAPLVKMFVHPKLWVEISNDLRLGITHPVVNWILSVLLVPGSQRFSESVLPRGSNIKTYLATLLRKAVIWNKPLGNLDTLIDKWRSWPLIVSILQKYVDGVYNEFLRGRKQMREFESWLDMVISVENEDVLRRIFIEQKTDALARWTEKYRIKLKTIQVVCKLPAIQPHTLELGVGMELHEIVALITAAEAEIPRVPDWSSLDICALMATAENVRDPSQAEIARFNRVTALFGAAEQLGSLATPGLIDLVDLPEVGKSKPLPVDTGAIPMGPCE